jgi:hypothetical protein
MVDYRYNLIRYVPDSARMEPINVGVILQGVGRIDVKFYQHAGKRGDVEAGKLRQWRSFFLSEIQTAQINLFQPDRNSEAFLRYLETLCNGPVYLSKPLTLLAEKNQSFETILQSLYVRLVAPLDVPDVPDEKRPTGTFRRIAEDRRFVDRGMRKWSHLLAGNKPLWMAYRQLDNGEKIAVDKVEVGTNVGDTVREIQTLPLISHDLPEFLKRRSGEKQTQYFLLVDQFENPFGGQTQQDFDLMRKDLDSHAKRIRDEGGTVLQSADEVKEFTEMIDKKLPPLPVGKR